MPERRSTWRGHDRRESPRPIHGDTRPCAECGGVMVFHEQPLLWHSGRPEPGWVCRDRHCSAREFVRRSES